MTLLVLQSLNPNVNVVFLLFVLHFILMIGNVELNPGPETDLSSSPLNLDNSSNDNSISIYVVSETKQISSSILQMNLIF